MRLVLFNVKYSPNLGDGLLSECLEMELRRTPQRPEVRSLDLAGRTGYSRGSRRRQLALTVLEKLPPGLRQAVANIALTGLVRGRLEPAWRAQLADVDGVIVGGGNLFADVDLNFPIKISGALAATRARDLPVAVFGVGATPNWSERGARLFRRGLLGSKLVGATVRDLRSQRVWHDALESVGVAGAGVVPDPGLLTAIHFPARRRDHERLQVALGVTGPVALRYHGAAGPLPYALDEWLVAVVGELAAAGFAVALFTNGSPEDQSFLDALSARARARAPGRVRVEPPFADPSGLARFIGECDLVLGHRMHAAVAAYSYGVPAIGFAWDVKMQSFFELIGYPDRLIDPGIVPPAGLAALAARALEQGVETKRREALITASRGAVVRLAALFDASAGRA